VATAAKLQPGGAVMPAEVFMTVVAAKPIFVRATVEEKDLHHVRQGLTGKAVPAGYPESKLTARLIKVSSVPQSAGSFEARVALETAKDAERLMPGMACTVKVVCYKKDDALTVPSKAVFTDEDEDVHYVYLAGQNKEKPMKRTVKVGKTAGEKIEIVDGLHAGDEILLHNPEKGPASLPSE
jgi:multidrug efflux pump subunit AcrA (membrane-fusion protein)